MLETVNDYISIVLMLIIFFATLKFLVGAIFFDVNKNYGSGIDIFLDYDDFDE
ncbi:MAG: hypothetical protein SPI53_02635 [Erysipelotrichaceae bacterium]|nr:hypothetical protein [Erysipelotrichaceae bacterium]